MPTYVSTNTSDKRNVVKVKPLFGRPTEIDRERETVSGETYENITKIPPT